MLGLRSALLEDRLVPERLERTAVHRLLSVSNPFDPRLPPSTFHRLPSPSTAFHHLIPPSITFHRLTCSQVEAARAYDRKARELHGDKALINFPIAKR